MVYGLWFMVHEIMTVKSTQKGFESKNVFGFGAIYKLVIQFALLTVNC